MSSEVLSDARCARHPEMEARRPCARCGAFMCHRCERRVRLDARPMCEVCFELRATRLAERVPRQRFARVALGIGYVAALLLLATPEVSGLARLVVLPVAIGLGFIAARRQGGSAVTAGQVVLGAVALVMAVARADG